MSRKQVEDVYAAERKPDVTPHGLVPGAIYTHKQHGYNVVVGFIASMQDSTYRLSNTPSGKCGQPPGAVLYLYRSATGKPGLWARERREFMARFRHNAAKYTWLHMKTGGEYRVVGEAKVSFHHCEEGDIIVCYKTERSDVDTGYVAMPLADFHKRFKQTGQIENFNAEKEEVKVPNIVDQILDNPVDRSDLLDLKLKFQMKAFEKDGEWHCRVWNDRVSMDMTAGNLMDTMAAAAALISSLTK